MCCYEIVNCYLKYLCETSNNKLILIKQSYIAYVTIYGCNLPHPRQDMLLRQCSLRMVAMAYFKMVIKIDP